MKGVPAFRQNFEDMNYYSPPSRFPMYTAYVEVLVVILFHFMKKLTNVCEHVNP